MLHSTNNFPEFTGRICPAPCEAACVLGINEPPVTIKVIEKNIIDHAFRQGWIQPEPPKTRTGKRVAVVGSGPAGLAAAQQLARAGHDVTVFEKADRIGGLLRYGIPDFKMEKHLIDRRIDQMSAEGVKFQTNAHIGVNVDVAELRRDFDAILLAAGAEAAARSEGAGPRTEGHPLRDGFPAAAEQAARGRSRGCIHRDSGDGQARCDHRRRRYGGRLPGHFAPAAAPHRSISSRSCRRRRMSAPTARRGRCGRLQLRVESSHEEGGIREWSAATTHFSGDENGNVKQLHGIRVGAPPKFEPIAGTEFTMDVDLVLLAMGFTGPVRSGMLEGLGVDLDRRGNVATGENYMSSVKGVFAAGDVRRGQSLVVWAISEGRKAAAAIDKFLRS